MNHEARRNNLSPHDRLDQIEDKLAEHGIMLADAEEDAADRIEGSPAADADPETAARVSAEKDRTIEELQKENDKLCDSLKDADDANRQNIAAQKQLKDAVADLESKLGVVRAERDACMEKVKDISADVDGYAAENAELEEKLKKVTAERDELQERLTAPQTAKVPKKEDSGT